MSAQGGGGGGKSVRRGLGLEEEVVKDGHGKSGREWREGEGGRGRGGKGWDGWTERKREIETAAAERGKRVRERGKGREGEGKEPLRSLDTCSPLCARFVSTTHRTSAHSLSAPRIAQWKPRTADKRGIACGKGGSSRSAAGTAGDRGADRMKRQESKPCQYQAWHALLWALREIGHKYVLIIASSALREK
eukprot:1471200-Rhodomonas_salina.1